MKSLHLFVRGFLVPSAVLYAILFTYVSLNERSIYGRLQALHYFRNDFIFGGLSRSLPNPEVVILGDSGAKVGFNPVEIGPPYAVNLAALYGNALTAYETMSSYYEHLPPPACVVMANQYEWKRSYGDFESNIVERDLLTFGELLDLWRLSAKHDVFPASELSFFPFWSSYLLHRMKLSPRILSNLKNSPESYQDFQERIHRLGRKRGLWSFGNHEAATEEEFYRFDANKVFTGGFQPSPSEDLFLTKLAQLSREKGSLLFLGSLPLAASRLGSESRHFQEGRRFHLTRLLAPFENIRWLNFPKQADRRLFFDFTHLNREGARTYSQFLSERLASECQSRRNFSIRARTPAAKVAFPARRLLSPSRYSAPE